jgi:hypothetical protein
MSKYEQFETEGMAAMNLGSEAAAEFQTLADMGGFRATKDMEAERREQERIELAQADRQRDMLKKTQKKQRKQADMQSLLTLIGAGVGTVVPGFGTAAGATIGSTVGSLFGQEGGEVPSGKFFQSGWENLRRRDEYLKDQKKAIKQALKPSLGKTLRAASQGFQTGSTIADFLQSPAGLKLADAGKKGFEYLFGSKAAAPKAGAYGWDLAQQQAAQDTPGLLGRFLEAKEKKKTDALFDLMLKNNPNYLSDFEAIPTATEEDLLEAFGLDQEPRLDEFSKAVSSNNKINLNKIFKGKFPIGTEAEAAMLAPSSLAEFTSNIETLGKDVGSEIDNALYDLRVLGGKGLSGIEELIYQLTRNLPKKRDEYHESYKIHRGIG